MSKQHDENQDVRILSRRIKVNQGQKAIYVSHSDAIGLRMWGRIDYLVHYCKYHLIWGDSGIITKANYEDSDKKEDLRKLKKEHKFKKNNEHIK